MKKILLPILLFVMLSLFACQVNQDDLIFRGEGEKWSAELTVKQHDGEENYQLKMNYKGNNIEDVETFRYTIESQNGVVNYSQHSAKLNMEGIFEKKLLSENSTSISEKDELVIKVEWNDSSETFSLVNE